MVTVLRSLWLLALVVWLGEVVFFSFVGAPGVFRTLPSPEAGRVVSAIFPIYYAVGAVCGLVLLASSLGTRGDRSAPPDRWVGQAIAGLMLAVTVYAGVVIQPRAAALRPQLHDASAAASVKPEFDRLHRLAVLLNGGVLLGGVALVVLAARSMR